MEKELFSQERRGFFSKIFIAGTGSVALLSLTGCGGSDGLDDPIVPLTADQKDTLLYIYQEEKVARDVYDYLDDIYNVETSTFSDIRLSEQEHMDAVEKLCIKYGVDISNVDESVYGVFILQELQDRYDTLITPYKVEPFPPLSDALQVGIDIETKDITDIVAAEAGMPSDVVSVFENIKESSIYNLGAFKYGGNKPVQLTDEQKATLLYMYQEEKVARDVYIWMDDIYGTQTNTFANIILSEQKHMDAVEKLCIKYGVDISGVDENDIGVFILPVLQDLYDTLILQDNTLEEALNVGILIEETDIADLEEAQVGMPNDVVRVFENIKEGSINHLGAFTYALSQLTP